MKNEFLSRQQLELMEERILYAQYTNASHNLYKYVDKMTHDYNFTDVIITGSGGSYPAAVYAMHALQESYNFLNIQAVPPQTALRIIQKEYYYLDKNFTTNRYLVIGISYSGKSPDIKAVYDVCLEKNYPFLLVTGNEKNKLLNSEYDKNDLLKIVSYYNENDKTGKEQSMISFTGTLAPVAIFNKNYNSSFKVTETVNALQVAKTILFPKVAAKIANSLKRSPIIHVFYEWDTFATASDIKSKFSECGIANVILHEKKNFSHGSYVALYKQDFGLVINLVKQSMSVKIAMYRNPYDEKLANFLKIRCEEKNAYYLEISSLLYAPSEWNFYALAKLPYLITEIGENLDIDISRFPKVSLDETILLYKYEGEI